MSENHNTNCVDVQGESKKLARATKLLKSF